MKLANGDRSSHSMNPGSPPMCPAVPKMPPSVLISYNRCCHFLSLLEICLDVCVQAECGPWSSSVVLQKLVTPCGSVSLMYSV